ncbi:MAG: Hsp20/alpha crystallin family protein [Cytophagaceae bacterium]
MTPDNHIIFGRSINDVLLDDFFESFDFNLEDYPGYYKISVPTKGFLKKDLRLYISENTLYLKGKTNGLDKGYPGKKEISRTFVLPNNVNPETIKAKYADEAIFIRIKKLSKKGITKVIKIKDSQDKRSWIEGIARVIKKNWLKFIR